MPTRVKWTKKMKKKVIGLREKKKMTFEDIAVVLADDLGAQLTGNRIRQVYFKAKFDIEPGHRDSKGTKFASRGFEAKVTKGDEKQLTKRSKEAKARAKRKRLERAAKEPPKGPNGQVLPEPGQYWKDCRPWLNNRVIKVNQIINGVAHCKVVKHFDSPKQVGKEVKVQAKNLRPGNRGYMFISY
jgi:hypothetical protein